MNLVNAFVGFWAFVGVFYVIKVLAASTRRQPLGAWPEGHTGSNANPNTPYICSCDACQQWRANWH